MKTKEELNKKPIVLSDEELKRISGGMIRTDSLEGLTHEKIGCGMFSYMKEEYYDTGMYAKDTNGILCRIYVVKGGGKMVLIPRT